MKEEPPAIPEGFRKRYRSVSEGLSTALGGQSLNAIWPELSDAEQRLLTTRFELKTGRLRNSQPEAARILGMGMYELVNLEQQTFDQVAFLASRPGEVA